MQILSLEIIYASNGGNDNGLYFIKGTKALDEEIWSLALLICMFIIIPIIALVNVGLKWCCDIEIERMKF